MTDLSKLMDKPKIKAPVTKRPRVAKQNDCPKVMHPLKGTCPKDYPLPFKTSKNFDCCRKPRKAKLRELVIKKQADMLIKSIGLDDALIDAAREGQLAIVRLLLKKGADIHTDDDEALKSAVIEEHLDTIKLLLREGANIHAEDDEALKTAVIDGHLDTIKLLLQEGADIHAQDDEALKLAASEEHLDIVKLLLQEGADIHSDNEYVLREAVRQKRIPLVKLLLKKGADHKILSNRFLKDHPDIKKLIETLEKAKLLKKARFAAKFSAKQRAKGKKVLGPYQYLSTDWQEICRRLGEYKLKELRDIAKQGGIKGYTKANKRQLCATLAEDYVKRQAVLDVKCKNDFDIMGTDFKDMPVSEFFIDKHGYCHSLDELEQYYGGVDKLPDKLNPYNKQPFTDVQIKKFESLKRSTAVNIHELKARERSLSPKQIRKRAFMANLVPFQDAHAYFPTDKLVNLDSRGLSDLLKFLSDIPSFPMTSADRSYINSGVDSLDKLNHFIIKMKGYIDADKLNIKGFGSYLVDYFQR